MPRKLTHPVYSQGSRIGTKAVGQPGAQREARLPYATDPEEATRLRRQVARQELRCRDCGHSARTYPRDSWNFCTAPGCKCTGFMPMEEED